MLRCCIHALTCKLCIGSCALGLGFGDLSYWETDGPLLCTSDCDGSLQVKLYEVGITVSDEN